MFEYTRNLGRMDDIPMARSEARGRTGHMVSLVGRRFGGEAAKIASPFLSGISDSAALDKVDDLFLRSKDEDQFLCGLRGIAGLNGSAG